MLNLYSLAQIGAKIEGEAEDEWAYTFIYWDQCIPTDEAVERANLKVEEHRASAWYREVC